MPSVKTKLFAVIILALLTAGIIALMGTFQKNEAPTEDDGITVAEEQSKLAFSAEDYFYTENLELEIISPNKTAEIYYTMDGTPPDSENGIPYTEPLLLKTSKTRVKSYTVKAVEKYSDGVFSETITHSYFIGKKVGERFDVPVIALSTDPYNLYDYDYGIFVEGRLRDEYIEETGERNPDPPAPANYNMRGIESERPVYVEVVTKDGQCVISQNAGMRNFGGYSRAMEQHSIKLYARSEYDAVKNDFDYDFFGDDNAYDGMNIDSFKRIVLRNCANDNPFAFLRDEAILECAEMTSLPDTQQTAPAAVFLNGEYYGFVWLHEVYDRNYLDDKNVIKDGNWCILGGSENEKEPDEDDPVSVSEAEAYTDMYEYFATADMNDDSVYNDFCSRVDVENFLTYYAVQTYVANGDWPRGNYKIYRYLGEPLDSGTADGKWRWLIYDTDFGLGLYGTRPSEKSLGILLGEKNAPGMNSEESLEMQSRLMVSLLKRDEAKTKFTEIMCDLMNFAYSPKNIINTVKFKEAERMNELIYCFRDGVQLKNTWSNLDYVSNQIREINDFAAKRPDEMKKQIVEYLGIEDSGFNVKVKQNEHAAICVNSCDMSKTEWDFEGFYFDINTVTVSAKIMDGYGFSHWLVNGTQYDDELLVLNKDYADEGNEITIELVTEHETENVRPIVTMVYYEANEDCIQLTNPYSVDIKLNKFFISDNSDDMFEYALPSYTLKAGESVMLYCKNYDIIDALGGLMLGFNLKKGETLYITSSKRETVQKIELPDLNNETCYIYNIKSGLYSDKSYDEWKSENSVSDAVNS